MDISKPPPVGGLNDFLYCVWFFLEAASAADFEQPRTTPVSSAGQGTPATRPRPRAAGRSPSSDAAHRCSFRVLLYRTAPGRRRRASGSTSPSLAQPSSLD